MNKVFKIFTGLFAFVGLIILASCGGSSFDVSGIIRTVDPSKDSFEVICEFDANDKISSNSAKPYVAVIKDDEQITRASISFSDKIYTSGTAKLTGLAEDTTYTIKLCVTYEGYSYDLDSTEKKTLSAEEENSEENPYLINNLDDLKNMTENLDAYYKLNADIDCDNETVNIFSTSRKFKGSFDGNGHTISNYNLSNTTYSGLFGYVDGGTIKNLKVDNITVKFTRGSTYFGSIIGYAQNATISNVEVSNVTFTFSSNSTTSAASIGAFAGTLSSCTLTDCSVVDSKIIVNDSKYHTTAGGFVGTLSDQCSVANCFAKTNLEVTISYDDTVSSSYTYVGGFVGADNSGIKKYVEDCYCVSNIIIKETLRDSEKGVAKDHKVAVGGFVGSNKNGYILIKNCFANVDINATLLYPTNGYIAGFAGELTDTQPMHSVKLVNCAVLPIEKGIEITPNEIEASMGANLKASMFVAHTDIKTEDSYSAATAFTNCFATVKKITPDTITIIDCTAGTDFSSFSDAIKNNDIIKALVA